jgi:hypothetical protein
VAVARVTIGLGDPTNAVATRKAEHRNGRVLNVVIGTQKNQFLAERVLEYSIRKHASREVNVRVMHQDRASPGGTKFGFVRFCVPSVCDFRGRAIYLDADQVMLGDIHELAEQLHAPHAVGIVRKIEGSFGGKPVAERNETSVMVFDCEQLSSWNPEKMFDPVVSNDTQSLEAGQIRYRDFMRLAWFDPTLIEEIDPRWNHYNVVRDDTKLVHFSHVREQPWKRPNHPFSQFWLGWLRETVATGALTKGDVLKSVLRGHAHPHFLRALL